MLDPGALAYNQSNPCNPLGWRNHQPIPAECNPAGTNTHITQKLHFITPRCPFLLYSPQRTARHRWQLHTVIFPLAGPECESSETSVSGCKTRMPHLGKSLEEVERARGNASGMLQAEAWRPARRSLSTEWAPTEGKHWGHRLGTCSRLGFRIHSRVTKCPSAIHAILPYCTKLSASHCIASSLRYSLGCGTPGFWREGRRGPGSREPVSRMGNISQG